MALSRKRPRESSLPEWVEPQLTQLVKEAPAGSGWAHEIKYDGYRIHAWFDRGEVRLLTRTGLDWTDSYPAIVTALRKLPVRQAYLDGELCALNPDGTSSFSLMQNAHSGRTPLVYFLFDLLYLDGALLMERPLSERKARLEELLGGADQALQYSAHLVGSGEEFYREACRLKVEGMV